MKRVSAKKKKSLNRNDSVSKPTARIPIINLDNSSSSTSADRDSDSDGSTEFDNARKKRKLDSSEVVLPVGFLAPLPPPKPVEDENRPETSSANKSVSVNVGACKQFWKAGDYEVLEHGDWDISSGGIDHVRVHPKFLHSNATSHKWALGAFAELLDNSLDEVCNGATYVNIDVIENLKNGSKMLLIEDNGGGMDPDKMRQCMSLGYSAKSKVANSIGQYGNGFKTSTMRLGADVIVFSRCCGSDGRRPTQSIGLLSYTFLRSTGKEDIVVPMLDYESEGQGWKKLIRSSTSDWDRNVETVVQWSPFSSEADLLCQFNVMQEHGTRIIIYNLWEDDEGYLELNFDADPHDIQLRGVNRDEKNITMASQYPNSKHFLTYRHSLRSYASILYLRLPPSFRIILRGQDVLHHNIVNDMMMSQQLVYRPQCAEGVPKDINMMTATVTVGFVKDAKHHIDVQGFNVYHKNRLIKPFWRIWNSAGSDGRGVIGVLEANFVEPAHDKQGFERTTVLARLESKLLQMQKNYWQSNCHRIGYAPRRNKKENSPHIESSPDLHFAQSSKSKTKSKTPISESEKSGSYLKRKPLREESEDLGNVKHGRGNSHTDAKENTGVTPSARSRRTTYFAESSSPCIEEEVSDDSMHVRSQHANLQDTVSKQGNLSSRLNGRPVTRSSLKDVDARNNEESSPSPNISSINKKLNSNISSVSKKLERRLDKAFEETDDALECENCAALQKKLEEAQKKVEELNKEQESLIDIFSEERERRDKEEENLRKKLKEESKTIQELLDKIKSLER